MQARGINGAGVNVGVISNGVPSLANSDLPAVTVNNTGCAAGTPQCDEGTAMLELVHDMAPGAGLFFDAGAGGGVVGHVGAQNWLAAAGRADVITEDIPFDGEPAFQYGMAASNGDAIAAGGVSMHSSAGNLGDEHAARMPATGTGQGPDGGTGPCAGSEPDNGVAIAGGADNTFDFSVAAGSRGSATLQWSEPRAIFPTLGRGGFTDLDLYVVQITAGGATCVAQSNNGQGQGVGDTIETVANVPPGTYKLVVDVENAPAGVAVPTLDLRMRGTNAIDTPTRAGSLNPDSNYIGRGDLLRRAGRAGRRRAGGLLGRRAGPVAAHHAVPGRRRRTLRRGSGGNAQPDGRRAQLGCGGQRRRDGRRRLRLAVQPARRRPLRTPPAATRCCATSSTSPPRRRPPRTRASRRRRSTSRRPGSTTRRAPGGSTASRRSTTRRPPTRADPTTTQEGTNVTLDGSGSSDPDTGDSLTYAWDFDDDGSFDDATGSRPSFDDVGRDGALTVRLRVTDTAGATAVDSSTVDVANVAPTVGAITTNAPKAENVEMAISGTVTDPGWRDPLSATIDFGDGTGAHALAGAVENVRPDATFSYDLTHAYGDDGTFTIKVCGADDDVTSVCVTTPVTVTNVAPTATIGEGDATDINGTSVILGHAGAPVDLSGRSTDPGSDDLTLRWSWDDGDPLIDVSTTYLVNPPNTDPDPSPTLQPRDVTDERSHAFGQACTYDVGFSALDDDAGSASDTIKVLIAGNQDDGRPTGYWAQQYRQRGGVEIDHATLTLLPGDRGLPEQGVQRDPRRVDVPEDAGDPVRPGQLGGEARPARP